MDATFPHLIFRQATIPVFVGASRDVRRSVNGAETVSPTFGGHWELQAEFSFRGEAAQLSWQAFLAQMEGQIGTTLVPIRTRFRPYDRDGHHVSACSIASLADGQTFEHFGFANGPVATMRVDAAPVRATDLRVTWGNTTGIRPGQYFGIGERLYQVQLHWQDGQGHIIRIRPGLREPVASGAVAILDQVVCRMRFASEGEGSFDQLLNRLPTVSVNFVEAI